MLILALLWLLVSASALGVGGLVVAACGGGQARVSAPALAWVGLAVISTICSFFSLLAPLGHGYGAALFALTLAPWAWAPARRVVYAGFSWARGGWVAAPALAMLFAGGLLKSSGPTEIFDDAVGYIVIFRAMLDQGIIIGLGNLHPNLAYNSHWSLLGAFYSFEWLVGRPLYDINGWLVWLGAWHAFSFLPRLWQGQLRSVYVWMAITPFFYFRNQMSGNSTDLPVAIVTWLLVGEWLLEPKLGSKAMGRLFWLFLPAFVLSVKITALALLALPIGYLALTPAAYRKQEALWALGILGLVLAPWFMRNVLMTGYLYYLLPKIDIFSVDWKMPRVVIHRLRLQVLYDFHHQPKVLSNPLWWRRWWSWGFNAQQHLMLQFTALSALVALLGYIWVGSRLHHALMRPRVLVVVAMLGVGLGFWFATPTEARYAHAWLVLSCLGLVGWAVAQVPAAYTKGAGKVLAIAITAAMLLPTYKTLQETPPQLSQELVWPALYPIVIYKAVQASNFTAYRPVAYKTRFTDRSRFPAKHMAQRDSTPNCWCTPLPCIYRPLDLPLLQQRGKTLRDGFRFTGPPQQ